MFIFVVEDLHDTPSEGRFPPILSAEIQLGQFALRGAGIKLGGAGEIGDSEFELFRFHALEGPGKAAGLVDHPALLGHFFQFLLDPDLVIKREVAEDFLGFFHDCAPFLRIRS